MTGIGIVIAFIGYVCIAWGINSIQGNQQQPFVSQIFPFVASQKTSG